MEKAIFFKVLLPTRQTSISVQHVVFSSLLVSISVLLPFAIHSTPSAENLNGVLILSAFLTFSLSTGMLPLCFLANFSDSNPKIARIIDHLSTATMAATSITALLALFNPSLAFAVSEILLNWSLDWMIDAGLTLLLVGLVYKIVDTKFPSCHHQYLNVAFLSISIAFAGLYTHPHALFPSPDSSFTHPIVGIYGTVLIPLTFSMGAVLLIVGVAARAHQPLPFVSPLSQEGLTVGALAVAFTTLAVGACLMGLEALVNSAMVTGFGPGNAIDA